MFKIRSYLEKLHNKKVKIIECSELGKGWHALGYKIVYKVNNKIENIVLKTIKHKDFSHDYAADRAKVFLLHHSLAKLIPNHIKSIDVGGITKKGSLVSIGNCKEFFQITEIAEGISYDKYLNRIMKNNSLTKKDKNKALLLSNYLVELHKKKYKGNSKKALSIYRRHTRDAIGDGEMLIGVIDTYPAISWLKKDAFSELIQKAVRFREKIKNKYKRLCRMHGDFHPGNIIFDNNKLKVLDASRELYGEPADDLTCLGINYIWYALIQKNNFFGPFKELFEIFWSNYLKKTKDYEINKIAPLFFAFRGVVVAHPVFYPKQSNNVRKMLFNLIENILDNGKFDYRKINEYIK